MKRRTFVKPFIAAVAVIVCVSLQLSLVPRFGMIAAAWCSVCGFATLAGVTWYVGQRTYYVEYEWKRVSIMVSLALVLSAISPFVPS
ncbi:hypothetical protein GQL56_29225, partial [Pseudomonas putida]|nr:hypothetical protein [Pseudomonas putida]